jgi:signal transduction histidine kinase
VIRAKRAEITAASPKIAGEPAGVAALLDRIAELADAPAEGALEAAREIGRSHAASRIESGAALGDVLGEFSALRAAIARCYASAQGGDARVEAMLLADAAIDAAMLGAAAHHDVLLQRARDAVRNRDDVLAVVSHDLGNPLGAVLMAVSSQLSPRAGEVADESTRKSLQSIHRATLRMRRLVQDLTDMVRIETGTFSVQKGAHAPLSLAQEAFEAFETDSGKRNIALHIEVGTDLPAVSCDRDRILQVLWTLVGNALASSRSGGAIRARAERHGDDVVFSVIDGGAGIPPEELPHVFERNRHGARYKSAGVGLSIARDVLAAHGGRIWAESAPGQGAAFHFTLPIAAN